MTLNNAQKKHLKALAHKLDARIQMGKEGLTEAFVKEVNRHLADHELVKVRLDDDRDARQTDAGEIAAKTASELVHMIGRVGIFYRAAEEPKIKLPA